MELPPVMDNRARKALAEGDVDDRRAVAHTGLKNGVSMVAGGRRAPGRRDSQHHSAFRRALITSWPPPRERVDGGTVGRLAPRRANLDRAATPRSGLWDQTK